MTKKPTYEELKQRVGELEREVVETRQAKETIRAAEKVHLLFRSSCSLA